jgi:DNA processing protein
MALDKYLQPWLRLALIPGLSTKALRELLVAFGSPDNILSASRAALLRHVPDRIAQLVCDGGAADALPAVGRWLDDPANQVLTLADDAYPQLLLQIPDPPPLIYTKGRVELLAKPALAVVGSRHATPQGMATAESFAQALSDGGLTIVSGLALGIDAAAHRGGLAGRASSIAVVGTGIDIVYPAHNRDLAHALARDGLLLSEFPLGTPALAANFPRRNRLISGIARGCLVVEAATASGSLITARLANEQGREVFAVPGSIHSPQSKGCHQLIKQGAKLTERAQDILEELGFPAVAPAEAPARIRGDKHAHHVLEQLGYEPCDIDALMARTGLDSAIVTAALSQLEIDGVIAVLPGGRFQRVR